MPSPSPTHPTPPSSSSSSSSTMLLILDWDETISAHDTLSLIAPPAGTHPGPPFTHYSQAYFAELEAHTASRPVPRTLDEQYAALDSIDGLERASIARIEAAEGGLFRGADLEALDERAARVVLRPGWLEAARWIERNKAHIESHIVSIGWSVRFIASALRAKECALQPRSICAHELEVGSDGRATGRFIKSSSACRAEQGAGMRVARHKLIEVQRLHAEWKQRGGKGLLVYAGDSTTDLMALLNADVGIVVGEAKSLKATLQRIGAERWLTPVESWSPEPKGEKYNLVQVRDWTEGRAVLQTLLVLEMAPPLNVKRDGQ